MPVIGKRLARWLLRTRGGLPVTLLLSKRELQAPPHARRSTPARIDRCVERPGSSARAEVYLVVDVARVEVARLLRTRGGLPPWIKTEIDRAGAPPHARRSTRIGSGQNPPSGGSSARAEVYPRRVEERGRPAGLLRTRGGLPITFPLSAVALGLLRTRGGLPADGVRSDLELGAPPHARRSTLQAGRGSAYTTGSSARAEVYRRGEVRERRAVGLLRTRGGLPLRLARVRIDVWAPPHARRSTLGTRRERRTGGGSSARAEVYPSSPR